MTRGTGFDSPFFLGFDHLERIMDAVAKSANDGFPPYNIEHIEPTTIRITLAVAGFGREDLSVSVEDNQLIVRGKAAEKDDRAYLHRGIAARQFLRKFVLADGIEVHGASLKDGLLRIDLDRPANDPNVRHIEIDAG